MWVYILYVILCCCNTPSKHVLCIQVAWLTQLLLPRSVRVSSVSSSTMCRGLMLSPPSLSGIACYSDPPTALCNSVSGEEHYTHYPEVEVVRRKVVHVTSLQLFPPTDSLTSVTRSQTDRQTLRNLNVPEKPIIDHLSLLACLLLFHVHKHTPYLPSWTPILEYMTEQFDKYLNEEVSINRKKVIPDTRVHCCLYFIPPTGHRSVCCSTLIVVVMTSHPHTFTPFPSPLQLASD